MKQKADLSASDTAFFSTLKPELSLANELWDYACTYYALPEVQHICLQMQDEFSADVNALLAAGWAASLGIEATWRAVLPPLERWQEEIISPLRKIRRKLNSKIAPENHIRSELLNLELKAEKISLAYLYESLGNKQVHIVHEKFARALLTKINLNNYINCLPDSNLPDSNLSDSNQSDRGDRDRLSKLMNRLSGWLCCQPASLTDI